MRVWYSWAGWHYLKIGFLVELRPFFTAILYVGPIYFGAVRRSV